MSIFRSAPPREFAFNANSGLDLHVAFVTPEYAPKILAGYQQLSERSRRMRFLGQANGLSSTQLQFLAAPDGRNHLAYAAEEQFADRRTPAAIARCIRLDPDSKMAEVAITVVDDYQHEGLGTLLHACLHRHASAVDIKQFIYDVSAENSRFVAHLTSLGADLISRDGDIVRLTLPVFGSVKSVGQRTPSAERFKAALTAVLDL